MSLGDHLRELRYRIVVSAAAVTITALACLVFYEQLLQIVLWPINQAIADYIAHRPGAEVELTTAGVTGGFSLYFKVAFTAGFILSCPVWLYQLWRFIEPGLYSNERTAALKFVGAAVPLFLMGVALGYAVTPKGFAVILRFNPPGVLNLNELNDFLAFELRLLLVFGAAFLLPVVLVTMNRMGLVRAKTLGRFRNVAVVACIVFSAIATPTTDAVSMLALAVPMVAMYLISEVICRAHDRKLVASGELVLEED